MSGILNSGMNGSTSTFPDATGRAFTTAFSSQLGSSAADMNHNDAIDVLGLRSINGNFNIPSMPGAYSSRNSGLNGVQPPAGSLSNGRYAVNNVPVALSLQSAASSLGLSGISNNGGIGQSIGNREQIMSSMAMGNLVSGGNIGRSLSSGGLNMPGVASRLNLTTPQMASLLGNSYSGVGGPLSQNQFQAGNNHLSSMALLSELNRDHSFDMNDFPQLSGHLSSAGGSQRLGGLARRQNASFMQQSQEFSIQNEDFPALPGYKGGNEFPVNIHQKEQLHDNAVSMMQSQQHLPVGRSTLINLGGAYSPQQQQHVPINGGGSYLPANTQDLHFRGSEARNLGMHATGSRPVNLSTTASGGGSYDQLMQQYQHFQKQSQIRLVNPLNDQVHQDVKSASTSQSVADRFGLLGLLNVIRMNNPDLTPLALGIDLMSLGLNLNSPDNLYKKFSSPWSDESAKGDPHYSIPDCFNTKQPSSLNQDCFSRFSTETLFYIFYSMPKDEAQLFAANELYNRRWFYHKELRLWFSRAPNMELLVKKSTFERGCYYCFDPNTWETIRKDNLVVQYDMVEDRPVVPRR